MPPAKVSTAAGSDGVPSGDPFLTALLVRHPSLRSVIDHLSPRNPQLVCSARAWSAFLLVANTKWEQVETKDGVMGPAAMAFKAALERDSLNRHHGAGRKAEEARLRVLP